MSQPPLSYSTPSTQSADDGHLRAIAVCHYVWGGLTLAFASFFIIYIVIGVLFTTGAFPVNTPLPTTRGAGTPVYSQHMTTVTTGGVTIARSSSNVPVPNWFGYFFIGFGTVAVLLGWTVGILTILSGRCIAKHRRRTFSLVMAGVNCASLPLGTLLGVFTFIVLLRASVKEMYGLSR